ncbi:unnamed protein product [Somion occarium]|uniref:Uncharacterized protein n=1 Tax=Somion occarium TaxID=3059160 RepID=A0ABP1EAE7_9APHY
MIYPLMRHDTENTQFGGLSSKEPDSTQPPFWAISLRAAFADKVQRRPFFTLRLRFRQGEEHKDDAPLLTQGQQWARREAYYGIVDETRHPHLVA